MGSWKLRRPQGKDQQPNGGQCMRMLMLPDHCLQGVAQAISAAGVAHFSSVWLMLTFPCASASAQLQLQLLEACLTHATLYPNHLFTPNWVKVPCKVEALLFRYCLQSSAREISRCSDIFVEQVHKFRVTEINSPLPWAELTPLAPILGSP